MKERKRLFRTAVVLTTGLLSVAVLGCASDTGKGKGEQRYAYPLGTASPEDTVTQIYAEKFAEEADRLSGGRIKISVYFRILNLCGKPWMMRNLWKKCRSLIEARDMNC